MRKVLFFIFPIICLSFLMAEEPPLFSPLEENDLSTEKDYSQFMYFAAGINPIPTLAVGYRKLFSSFGSDFSITASVFPIGCCGKVGIIPIPGINYIPFLIEKSA